MCGFLYRTVWENRHISMESNMKVTKRKLNKLQQKEESTQEINESAKIDNVSDL